MTRQQVAKRLGKSLATVRRLEGGRLRPVQDRRGVHRFDPAEVEGLASDIENGRVELWQELGPASGDRDHANECANCVDLKERMESLRGQVDAKRSNHQRELASLQAEHERQIARYDADARALVAQVAELVASLQE